MKTKILLLLVLISSNLFAQKLPREILYGQLIADSIAVENVLITNKTTNLATVSKNDGTFQIAVRVKDTLVFSGLNLPSQNLILNDADLKLNVLKIKIEVRPNALEEVVINPNALSGNLDKDSKNIKVNRINPNIDNSAAVAQLYEGDSQTTPDNKLMPGYLDTRYMTDFVAIGKKIARVFKRSESQKQRNKDVSRFSVVVENRFSDDFFKNNLKINQDEITKFLNFCENDPKSKELITAGKDFELIEFLKLKKEEFSALKKE